MRDLLFLAHRIPYPPDKGDKIRSWNMLGYLAKRYRVHLGCFVDDPRDHQFEPMLREICGECCFVRLNSRLARLRGLRGLATGAPITLPYYWSSVLAAWANDVITRINPDTIFYFSSAMAQYARQGPAHRVIDFVDVDSQKWGEYARRQPWPKSWIYGREGRRLLDFERDVAASMDASIFVSSAEEALFAELAPALRGRLFHVNNGVDTDYFSPARTYERPFGPDVVPVVFTGAMDYWPNIDAVDHFARDILPALRERLPSITFWIVGSKPAAAVTALATLPGVVVTGRVPDIRPYLAHASVVVAPLRIARGIQNKVLEAMAMGRPVVASPQAADGIGGVHGREYLVADGAAAFVNHIFDHIKNGLHASIGTQARNYVLTGYDWAGNLAKLDQILNGTLTLSGENEARCKTAS